MGEIIQYGTLDRREVVARLLAGRKKVLVVAGIGWASFDVMAAGDHDNNFYLWGAMGSAAMIGLGLATARPDYSVLVLTGDGDMLMSFGALATIAIRNPANLTVAVLDNGHFGQTGWQESHTGRGLALEQVAKVCGFSWSSKITNLAGVDDLRDRLYGCSGVKFAAIKISANTPPRVVPPRDGSYIKNRFRSALGLQPI
ncbi:thiamine pyrophosphate-dependent enzyme [Bradyrhizobium zhanjiangense]|uniref:Aldehyde dehydrogenase n=1 Tax=Bradyrhizobium zhanjiangense TaxID=1325107 RepID=A0ABY0D9H0_9BRAD|nr:thiamine pyrophosphate-dependent enzyme [Bradyrhizobium zhanjiangense]RXG86632.1 aldehyde dehydrogenase [Bradyrhizobium zhanjiangense]